MGLAIAARNLHKYDLAIRACKRVLEKEPEDGSALSGLGHLYLLEGNLIEAESYLKRALSLKDPGEHLLLNSGIVNLRLGQRLRARSHFKRALRVLRKYKEPNRAIEGWLQVVTGDRRAGLKNIRAYLSVKPDLYDLYNLWSWTHALLLSDEFIPLGMQRIEQLVNAALSDLGN